MDKTKAGYMVMTEVQRHICHHNCVFWFCSLCGAVFKGKERGGKKANSSKKKKNSEVARSTCLKAR